MKQISFITRSLLLLCAVSKSKIFSKPMLRHSMKGIVKAAYEDLAGVEEEEVTFAWSIVDLFV